MKLQMMTLYSTGPTTCNACIHTCCWAFYSSINIQLLPSPCTSLFTDAKIYFNRKWSKPLPPWVIKRGSQYGWLIKRGLGQNLKWRSSSQIDDGVHSGMSQISLQNKQPSGSLFYRPTRHIEMLRLYLWMYSQVVIIRYCGVWLVTGNIFCLPH